MNPPYAYPTTDLLKQALGAMDYHHETLVLDNRYFTRFVAPTGQSWLTSNARVTYPFVNSSAKVISKDKRLAYALAGSQGITIPFTRTVTLVENAEDMWDEVARFAPLIVKPSSSTLSRGLSRNISSEAGLSMAIKKAQEFSPEALVQKQVQGDELRFAVLDGSCHAAIVRFPAQLKGDGKSTVTELLDAENKDRAAVAIPNVVYPQLEEPIVDLKSIDMDRVLQKDEILRLGASSMIRNGASAYNVFGQVHPSYLQAVEKLAAALGSGFVAVDLLIEDYTQPLTVDNYAFLEFNMSPNLGVFYGCRDGRQYDILSELAPMIDAVLTGGRKTGK